MKYTPPVNGSYEYGLSVKEMYRLTHELMEKHISQEILSGRTTVDAPEKLWDIDPIRGELEEFVDSYFLDALPTGPKKFEAAFRDNMRKGHSGFDQYLTSLLSKALNEQEVREQLTTLFSELEKRQSRMYKVIDRLKRIDMPQLDELIKINAQDAFSHISTPYIGGVLSGTSIL